MTRPQLWGRLLGCGAWCVAGQLWWLLCIRLPRRRFEVDSRTGRAYVWLLCRAYGWYDRQWMEWRGLMDETEAMLRRKFGTERYTLEDDGDEDGAALLARLDRMLEEEERLEREAERAARDHWGGE